MTPISMNSCWFGLKSLNQAEKSPWEAIIIIAGSAEGVDKVVGKHIFNNLENSN